MGQVKRSYRTDARWLTYTRTDEAYLLAHINDEYGIHAEGQSSLVPLVPDTRLQEIADLVELWEQAYPTDIFPEPPKGEHGDTVDACSARMGRFMVGLLRDALTEEDTQHEAIQEMMDAAQREAQPDLDAIVESHKTPLRGHWAEEAHHRT